MVAQCVHGAVSARLDQAECCWVDANLTSSCVRVIISAAGGNEDHAQSSLGTFGAPLELHFNCLIS